MQTHLYLPLWNVVWKTKKIKEVCDSSGSIVDELKRKASLRVGVEVSQRVSVQIVLPVILQLLRHQVFPQRQDAVRGLVSLGQDRFGRPGGGVSSVFFKDGALVT